jgi:hypothetical protein
MKKEELNNELKFFNLMDEVKKIIKARSDPE